MTWREQLEAVVGELGVTGAARRLGSAESTVHRWMGGMKMGVAWQRELARVYRSLKSAPSP